MGRDVGGCGGVWLVVAVTVAVVAMGIGGAWGYNVTVSVRYPAGRLVPQGASLYVRGDGCGLSWDKGVVATVYATDEWRLVISAPNDSRNTTLQLKVLVNDNTNLWQIGANSVYTITPYTYIIYVFPWFYTSTGGYEYIRNVVSPQLQNNRDLVVYLPPSFYENTYKVYQNILVMHDGQNLFNASTSYLGIAWQCQDTVDQQVVAGTMEEIVIIGVDNTDDRNNELTFCYDPSEFMGGKNDMYLDYIEQTVIPTVMESYAGRLAPTRDRLGILGSSLGGITSCFACWTRSDVYGLCGCMSSSFWWDSEAFLKHILMASLPMNPITIYIDSGTDNDDMPQTIAVRGRLEELGWVLDTNLFYYLDVGGQHNEYYWGKRFWIPMTDLYPVLPVS
ncbi:alpha/beta hydrolase [Pelomyxa schiedti]|nr:alpha/beta hydrolase [Pelomyxa schiedti]